MATNNAVNATTAPTGTGNLVLQTSPTLITPTLGVATATSVKVGNNGILDANGNEAVQIPAAAVAVNYWQASNSATGVAVRLIAAGADANIIAVLNGKGTSGCAISGATDAGVPPAGYVGEIATATVLSGAPVAIVTATPTNLTSFALTAGDWDVYGNVYIVGTGAAITAGLAWCSLTSATLPDPSLFNGIQDTTATSVGFPAPYFRVNVAALTTVYLSGYVVFTGGTCAMSGGLYARRIR